MPDCSLFAQVTLSVGSASVASESTVSDLNDSLERIKRHLVVAEIRALLRYVRSDTCARRVAISHRGDTRSPNRRDFRGAARIGREARNIRALATHRGNTNAETTSGSCNANTQHVTSPRSSRDGLRYGNERACERSRTATPETPPSARRIEARHGRFSGSPSTDRTTLPSQRFFQSAFLPRFSQPLIFNDLFSFRH